jgi:hypothetical protein
LPRPPWPIANRAPEVNENGGVSTIEGRSVADPGLPHRSSKDLKEHEQAE